MYTALIADDEPWVAYGLAHLIDWEACGFQVIDTALDGLCALEKVTRLKPDLLVSDIRMPGLDGLMLMHKIKEASLSTEVVFVSGYTEFEYAVEAVRLGAFDYLVKQVEAADLMAVLKRAAQKIAQKQAGDWDTYFRLFDEEGNITAADCAGLLGLAGGGSICRFAALVFDAPVDKPLMSRTAEGVPLLLFRTGACKMAVLAFEADVSRFEQACREELPDAAAMGLSEAAEGSASFYRLFRQADLAAGAAREHAAGKTMAYGEAKALLEKLSHKPRETPPPPPLGDGISQARQVLEALDVSFAQDIHITDLARQLYLSPNYLCTLVKRATGMTYSDYIITRRMEYAKRLLKETELSIQEVIDRIGYKDYAHFNKLFKRREGVTPSKYRRGQSTDAVDKPQ